MRYVLATFALALSGCRQPNPSFDARRADAHTSTSDANGTTADTDLCTDACTETTTDTSGLQSDDTTDSADSGEDSTSSSQQISSTSTGSSHAESTTGTSDESSLGTSASESSISDSTSATESTSESTTEPDPVIPTDSTIPFPDPPCDLDTDLLACFLFDDDTGVLADGRGTFPEGSGTNITFVQHSSQMPTILQKGWRLDTTSLISIDVGNALTFVNTATIELWWGMPTSAWATGATYVDIGQVLQLASGSVSGLDCRATATGHGVASPSSLSAELMYTRCVIAAGSVLMSHEPGTLLPVEGDAPGYDFTEITPTLSIGREAGGNVSTPMTLYGLRIWKKNLL